jgi:hypothetical protein
MGMGLQMSKSDHKAGPPACPRVHSRSACSGQCIVIAGIWGIAPGDAAISLSAAVRKTTALGRGLPKRIRGLPGLTSQSVADCPECRPSQSSRASGWGGPNPATSRDPGALVRIRVNAIRVQALVESRIFLFCSVWDSAASRASHGGGTQRARSAYPLGLPFGARASLHQNNQTGH